MPTMTQSSQVLYVFLAAGAIGTVVSRDCAFIPGPVTVSNDTATIEVDCHKQQPGDAGLADTTGNNTGVVVYLVNCAAVPVGLFVDVSAKLSTVAVVSNNSQELLEGTFDGLENVAELRLEGFQTLRSLSSAAFRPLRSLERLVLVGFGAHTLTYAQLGAALYELSGTPLTRIVMHKIHSAGNEKILDVTALFRMQNVSVRELTFSDSIVTSISGRISRALPDLNYVCVGANARYYAAMNALLDMWLFLPEIHDVHVYAFPIPDTLNTVPSAGAINIGELDFDILVYLSRYLSHENCYSGLKLPLSASLRRLVMRNLQVSDSVIDKPFCFDSSNNVERLDFAGCPLPTDSLRVTGLDQLKYFDIQNTGVSSLPDDFLRYFPKLEAINLVQLQIGASMKHINSSFFGNCATLREIHLGDCQLTTLPSTAFVFVPSLQTLNLSSNSLRTFDINLSNSRHLSHLNLSDNAISTLSEDVLGELNAIAQHRLQAGGVLTVDLRRNPLSCLCNSTHFVRQLQDWVKRQEVNVAGFEEYTCLYPNGSVLATSHVDVNQSSTECGVLGELKNGSRCPCDDHLRHRLELVRLSLDGYVCRTSDGKLMSMTVQPLPSCPDFFRNATFIAPVVTGGVLALALVVISIVLYRHRKNERVRRVIERLTMNRIVRLGIQHVMARHRDDDDPSTFKHDVFLYIQDDDQELVQCRFDDELCPHRHVLRHDDFSVGLKLETLLANVRTCRWLVPVLSANFVDDGECCDFIVRAQYSRPHAIVPVVWTPFHTDDLTITSLLDTAEPVTWPGDQASDAHKAAFWQTLLERTSGSQTSTV